MIPPPLPRFADVEQRSKWLPRLASMELLGSYCLTEPGAGSDAGSLITTAVPTADGHYLVKINLRTRSSRKAFESMKLTPPRLPPA